MRKYDFQSSDMKTFSLLSDLSKSVEILFAATKQHINHVIHVSCRAVDIAL